jgi:hypothetical protein
MKYIRTKDNIYEVYARERCPNGCVITTSGVKVPYTDILRESDTAEALCDELVVIYNNNKAFKKPFTSIYDNLKDLLKEHEISKCKVYGAIWTDKGLIYKAKMNEKGELELL